ncbi:ATPase [Mobilicoccus caccae]|uniref:ATPase n=1 Tax=Mobilicoccus caccae TaxID=1859295 RepID=A0ABQ6IUG3_9MICO|nr:ATPase [Mobilicoccus caccae]
MSTEQLDAIRSGYATTGAAMHLGAAVSGASTSPTAHPDVQVSLPLSVLNRHGLVAGATGTGKTKTLQLMAEQLSTAGVPVFLADMKGDLSGLGAPGAPSERTSQRAADVGQTWEAAGFPVEFFSLGGRGSGIPMRATITDFGPMLLSKVLGLNAIQTSSLGLVFHYADKRGLPLLDLKDLRAVVQHLTSDEGKADLKELGGLSSATAGVILRSLIAFSDQGADVFFGEPELDTADLLRTCEDGRGLISCLELPAVQDRPAMFSTFLMWLLADLFQDLPEVGDVDKPKLVFFFDEAHLLFDDASKEFVDQIEQTVRLIRSKGVGVFFVTQSPRDVPAGVLGQLGNRVQHALRAFTPEDEKALRATVKTFPKSEYDLGELLTSLGIGEAVVTVLSERGVPTPVAWTRMRAPQSLMAPMEEARMQEVIAASPLGPSTRRRWTGSPRTRSSPHASPVQARLPRAAPGRRHPRRIDLHHKAARSPSRSRRTPNPAVNGPGNVRTRACSSRSWRTR